jgi:hypothetical protein
MAVAGLVCGMASIGIASIPPLDAFGIVDGIASIPLLIAFGIGLILGILGLVFGVLGVKRIYRSNGALVGRNIGIAGAICGGISLGIFAFYLIVVLIVSVA